MTSKLHAPDLSCLLHGTHESTMHYNVRSVGLLGSLSDLSEVAWLTFVCSQARRELLAVAYYFLRGWL